ncbi:hypothetical protein [Streptomyces sp. NPDC046976]|uniref:hypothetical protein n=1 Tax=Streptomyces sp. NPDC046976 TaxID=3155258 RepID=UPI0033EA5D5D
MFDRIVRSDPVLAPREVYETKAARRRQQWPEPDRTRSAFRAHHLRLSRQTK